MRFTTFLVSGALAAVAVAQSATTSANVPESSVTTCLNKCPSGGVDCQARCIAVPSPNTQNIANTQKCVEDCPQGNGSPAETDKYSKCVQGCIHQNYYVSGEGTPNPTGASGNNGNNGGSASGSEAAATATGTGASPSGTGSSGSSGSAGSSGSSGSKTTGSESASGTQSGTGASATKTGAAAGLTVGSSGAFVGALAALLAL